MNTKIQTLWCYTSCDQHEKHLKCFGMVDCHPKGTPLDVDLNLGLLDCPDEVNAECSLIFQVCINGQGHSTRPWLCSIFLVQISAQT